VLGTAKGLLRRFRRLEALVGYLKEIGLEHFDVDATLYSSGKASSMRSNSAPRAQDEAVDHEVWFREEVQRTLEGGGSRRNSTDYRRR
jgi:hypothetical protein